MRNQQDHDTVAGRIRATRHVHDAVVISRPGSINAVLIIDTFALNEEIQYLGKLVDQACALERREVESKLNKLKQVLSEQRIFIDPRMKLLVFTGHKETLDYIAGDGKDGCYLGKLPEWGLTCRQIHGGMPIGDRDTPNTLVDDTLLAFPTIYC